MQKNYQLIKGKIMGNNHRKTVNVLKLLTSVLFFFAFDISNNAQDKTNNNIKSWFTNKQVAENVWQIEDYGNDNTYLVKGDKKALLIDTGLGVADLYAYIKSLVNLPVIIVNTHSHPDHCGGDFQFDEVFIHPADSGEVAVFCNEKAHEKAVEQAGKRSSQLRRLLLKVDVIIKIPKIHTVSEGFVFDLGNRKLEVIEVPGHTKGSICLLDKKNKLLFSGDNNNTTVWLFLEKSLPLETYLKTLRSLQKRAGDFATLLPGHGDVLNKDFLDELTICTQNILNGECKAEPYKTFVDYARVCSYKRARVAFAPNKLYVR